MAIVIFPHQEVTTDSMKKLHPPIPHYLVLERGILVWTTPRVQERSFDVLIIEIDKRIYYFIRISIQWFFKKT